MTHSPTPDQGTEAVEAAMLRAATPDEKLAWAWMLSARERGAATPVDGLDEGCEIVAQVKADAVAEYKASLPVEYGVRWADHADQNARAVPGDWAEAQRYAADLGERIAPVVVVQRTGMGSWEPIGGERNE